MRTALAARDLLVRVGSKRAAFELCVEALELGAGSVLAVLGPNGSGKSTLLRALAGLEPLRAGSVERRVDGPVTMVFQRPIALPGTVAGNLDHAAVNRWHQVSPMPDSLNPIDVAPQVSHIPQRHFSGADDRVVPTAIARDFVARAAPCAALQVLPGMGHESDWPARWPTLLRAPLPCTGEKSPDRQR